MRPDENDAPDRDPGGSLADGREDVATGTDPFGDEFEDDGGFGDGSTEPVEDDGGDLVPDEDTGILENVELDLEGNENDPLEGVGYLIEELKDALLGEDDETDVLADPSPFDADPADVASDTDLDLSGDGLVDGHDLDEAGSILDFDVTDG
jgi:hypothetical protein